jgi:hypothetical protein
MIVTTETTQPTGDKTGVRFALTVSLISYQPVDKRTLKYTVKDTGGKITSTNTTNRPSQTTRASLPVRHISGTSCPSQASR